MLLERLAPAKSVVTLERAIDMYRNLGDTTLLGFALPFAARGIGESRPGRRFVTGHS
jgi:hypothetical protein